MSKPKKYDTYKECTIRTSLNEYIQIFTSDWTFSDIRAWMLDTYCIDETSIVEICLSSVTKYKYAK